MNQILAVEAYKSINQMFENNAGQFFFFEQFFLLYEICDGAVGILEDDKSYTVFSRASFFMLFSVDSRVKCLTIFSIRRF